MSDGKEAEKTTSAPLAAPTFTFGGVAAFTGSTFQFPATSAASSSSTTAAAAPAASAAAADDGEEGGDAPDATLDGEHTGATFEPVVKLTQFVEVKTAEEDETVVFKCRAKMYRFDGEWKERGTGDLKILKHKEKGTVRVLMRRDKTHKVCSNHYILPGIVLSPNVGSDKSWMYSANDFSDGEAKAEVLCVKFTTVELSKEFKEHFENAQKDMEELKKKLEAEKKDEDKEEKKE